jgi:hypothetical protein
VVTRATGMVLVDGWFMRLTWAKIMINSEPREANEPHLPNLLLMLENSRTPWTRWIFWIKRYVVRKERKDEMIKIVCTYIPFPRLH